jgi:hypothetical protein
MVRDLLHQGAVYAVVSDIRHWFHQISVGENLKRFFGIKCKETKYRMEVLPMGWSYSPRICQCLAWAIILYKPNDGVDALDEARNQIRGSRDPPRFVNLVEKGKKVGFIVLTYDNIGVFCLDKNVRDAITARLRRNFVEANIVMKVERGLPEDAQDPTQMSAFKKLDPADWCLPRSTDTAWSGLEYLGVEYAFIPGRKRVLVCRHVPRRIEKWKALRVYLEQGQQGKSVACQTISRIIGVILWHQIIKQQPLCHLASVIEISSRVSTLAFATTWEQPITLDTTEWETLGTHLEEALQNGWCQGPTTLPLSHRCVLFSDASNEGFGWVLCNEDGTLGETPVPREFPQNLKDTHIFVRELFAAVLAIQTTLQGKRNAQIFIGVDNSAVFFCLNSFYSTNLIACQWLSKLHQLLQEKQCTLVPFQLRSEHNPADPISRHQLLQPSLLMTGWKSMQEYFQGRLMPGSIYDNEKRQFAAGVRHAEFAETQNVPLVGEPEEQFMEHMIPPTAATIFDS